MSPSNKYSGWISFRIDWWITLKSKGLSRVFSTTIQKHQFFGAQPSVWSNSHTHTWLLKKTIALTIWSFVSKVISLLFNMVSRFVIAFLPRSKHLLISWLKWPCFMAEVILEPKKIKSVTVSIFSPHSRGPQMDQMVPENPGERLTFLEGRNSSSLFCLFCF